ncbi:MAG TPA: hypothetical protein VIA18_22455, partial [Polyangia bacterium]|nr:hypothetical protein [Polyangia bacterium]
SVGATPLAGAHSAIWGADAQTIYVVGAAGEILRLDSAGDVTPQTVPVTTTLNGVYGTGAGDIYAVGDSGVVLHSAGDGSWTALPAPADVDYMAVFAVGADVFAVASSPTSGPYATLHGGILVNSADAGQTWTQSTYGAYGHPGDSQRPSAFFAVSGTSASDVYAVGGAHLGTQDSTIVYHFDGATWSPLALAYDTLPWAQYPAEAGHDFLSIWNGGSAGLFVGGVGEPFSNAGGIFSIVGGVATQEKVPLEDGADLIGVAPIQAIWGPSPSTILAAAGAQILLRPSDGGPWCLAATAAGGVRSMWGPPGGNWFYALGNSIQKIQIQ